MAIDKGEVHPDPNIFQSILEQLLKIYWQDLKQFCRIVTFSSKWQSELYSAYKFNINT